MAIKAILLMQTNLYLFESLSTTYYGYTLAKERPGKYKDNIRHGRSKRSGLSSGNGLIG
jgi:hypothetical protein